MSKYKITIETRQHGAIGNFQEDILEITADTLSKAKDMAFALVRRNNLEPRFITKIELE